MTVQIFNTNDRNLSPEEQQYNDLVIKLLDKLIQECENYTDDCKGLAKQHQFYTIVCNSCMQLTARSIGAVAETAGHEAFRLAIKIMKENLHDLERHYGATAN